MVVDSKKASAGRVLIKPRGEWDANITYYMLDLINHNGHAFLAKKTVVGIEPGAAHSEYWHNFLDIDKIVKESISGTLAEDVGDILEERFKDMLSEARYVSDLNADCDTPTFVQWDAETENTPYKAGLTTYEEGFALVHGVYTENHTISAWTKGGAEHFTHSIVNGVDNGWGSPILSSGGTMKGPLALGGGKGSVSADNNYSYLEATKASDDYRRIEVKNPSFDDSLDRSVNLATFKNGQKFEYPLFGEHNLPLLPLNGFNRIAVHMHSGTGVGGSEDAPTCLNFPFAPRVVIWLGATYKNTGKFVNPTGEYKVIICENLTTEWKYQMGIADSNASGIYAPSRYAKKSVDGKTIYLYDTVTIDDGFTQCNANWLNYWFVIIG